MPCPVPNLSQPRQLINSRIHQSSLFNNLGASFISASLLVLWGTVNSCSCLSNHAAAVSTIFYHSCWLLGGTGVQSCYPSLLRSASPQAALAVDSWRCWVPLIVWLHWDNLWGILNYLKGYLSCFILSLIIFLLFQMSGFSYVCASLYIIFQLKILLNNTWDRVFKRLTTKRNFLRVYRTNPPGNCTLSILCCPILTLWQQHCRK